MNKAIKAFGYLFNFRKPQFTEFEFVDLVVDNKPLFYFKGSIKHGYKFKILPHKKTYRKQHLIVILPIKTGDSITITTSNLWRKNSRKIFLAQTSFDEKTISALKLKPGFTLKAASIINRVTPTVPTVPNCHFKIQPQIPQPTLTQKLNIKVKPFIYP